MGFSNIWYVSLRIGCVFKDILVFVIKFVDRTHVPFHNLVAVVKLVLFGVEYSVFVIILTQFFDKFR